MRAESDFSLCTPLPPFYRRLPDSYSAADFHFYEDDTAYSSNFVSYPRRSVRKRFQERESHFSPRNLVSCEVTHEL